MNIIDFIEARIAEDEQIAQAARPGPWIDEHGTRIGPKIGDGYLMVPESELAPCEDYIPNGDTTHIARHDPARALRQCKALRVTVRAIEELVEDGEAPSLVEQSTIRNLAPIASIWSDHPDYDTNWS